MQWCRHSLTRDGMEKVSCGELLDESEASKVRRAIARINYMALDRADLSSVARIAWQYMSEPRQGTEIVVKRVIRYLKSYPRMPNHISKKSDENQRCVEVMTDSDWASDTKTRRSCSGGLIRVGGNLIHHWSKTKQTVALSSGEAEMNASVKAISEGIGVTEFAQGDLHQGCDNDRLHGLECVQRSDLAQRQWQSKAPHHETTVGSRRSSST